MNLKYKKKKSDRLSEPKRTFVDVADVATNQEKNFAKAALKAYLKGNQMFRFGYIDAGGVRIPHYYSTPERWVER